MILKKIIPYLYFIVGIGYFTNRMLLLTKEDKEFYLLFGKKTESIYLYIGFTILITVIVLFLGYKRYQQYNKNKD